MRRRHALALALTATLAAVLLAAAMPAAVLDAAVAAASAGRLRLTGPAGTVWSGSAQLAAAQAERVPAPWLQLDWRFDAGALLRGRLDWRVAVDGGETLRLGLGYDGVAIEALALSLPVAPLTALHPHPALQFGWQGRLALQSPAFACDWQGRCSGELRAEWTDAASALFPEPRLGDYRLALRADDGRLEGGLSSADANALRLDGRLALPARRGERVELRVDGDPALLARLPSLLGDELQRDAERGLRLRF